MNNTLMFSKASNTWATPQNLFDQLNAEFHFTLDAAASTVNTKCERFFGPGGCAPDALTVPWVDEHGEPCAVWLNPPYSHCREFIATAAASAIALGSTVVCLVPSRTDTRWWHDYVWDQVHHCPRPGVQVRFLKGRLKFGWAEHGAPFPSVVIVFTPPPHKGR